MRIQGGTSGIISAILFGRLDPVTALAGEDHPFRLRDAGADRRERDRRALRAFKKRRHHHYLAWEEFKRDYRTNDLDDFPVDL